MDEFQKDVIERLTRVETTLSNHLAAQEAKFNKTTIILGIVIAGVAIYVSIPK